MPSTLQDIKRATYVIRVLHKHGLGEVIKKAGLTWHLHLFDRHRKLKGLPDDLPQKIRAALEELGGAYVKLGQLLSIRPDLVPPEYCKEFSKLQDHIEAEPFTAIRQTIEQELEYPVSKLFSHIDHKPIGSASIAQVHKARLKNGKAVVIKVQRPDVKDKFEEDIDILKYIARRIEKHVADTIKPSKIIEEFEAYTKKELDFECEANHMEIIRDAKVPRVKVPKIHPHYSTSKILTMDYLDGIKVKEIKNNKLRNSVAKKIIDTALTQAFDYGVFHADLHPGNILLLRNHDIGLLDFGIVGRVEKRTTDLGIKIYMAILDKDDREIIDVLMTYGRLTHATNTEKFKAEVREAVDRFFLTKNQGITYLLYSLFMTCSRNHIVLPKNAVLLGKALVTAEGTAKSLDPKFDFVTYAENKMSKIMEKKKSPKRMLKQLAERSKNMSEILEQLPKEGLELLQTIKRGRATLELDDKKFRRIGFDINNSSNRLSYALIAASFIVAGSRLHQVPPFIGGYSIPVVVMYGVALLFIIMLISSIAKEPKRRRTIGGA